MVKIKKENVGIMNEINTTKSGAFKTFIRSHQRAIVVAGILVAIAAYGIWQNHQNRKLQKMVNQLQGGGASDKEVAALVKAVGKLVILPDNEDPTVATVTDPQKLSDQPFFANAKTGDKVLIYASSKKAILYRPSENKIVHIAPVNSEGSAAGDTQIKGGSTEPVEKSAVQITVQNRSQISGLANKVAKILKDAGYANVTVDTESQGTVNTTTITYGEKFAGNTSEIKKLLGDQGDPLVQIGASGIVIVIGKDFKL